MGIPKPGVNWVMPESEKKRREAKKGRRKKEIPIQKNTMLNYIIRAEIKEENRKPTLIPQPPIPRQLIKLRNIPGTSSMNFFQDQNSNSNRSIKFEPQTPRKNTTMNPKASALVEEYRNIDQASMDAMLAQLLDDPEERKALQKFTNHRVQPLVNHSKKPTAKPTTKTKGRQKITPPKNQRTIAQMFKKAESKKSNK